MSLKSQVTRILINGLPETIIDRLSHHEPFVNFADFNSVGYSDFGVFEHEQVLLKLQAIYENDRSVVLINTDGTEFKLERLEGGLQVTPMQGDTPGRLVPEFQFLDPKADVRLKALRETAVECLPSLISESRWQTILAKRVLSEFELAQLVSDIRLSPNQFLAGLSRKWHSGTINSEDLFPRSLSYYEALVGPCPKGEDAENYINDILIPYQNKLLKKSPEIGLKYILPMNVDRRISPADLVNELPVDSLLESLTTYAGLGNPFVRAGALEIAISRLDDHKGFCEIAEKIAQSIADGILPESDHSNYYEIMPTLIQTCLRWISVEEEIYGAPPYWRRLAAFTHAHFIFDVLSTHTVNAKSFIEWCNSFKTTGMITTLLIDLQKEPLWHSDILTPVSLREDIVGHLIKLDGYLKSSGNKLSKWPDIDNLTEELKAQGVHLFATFPGPMEGGKRLSHVEGADITNSQPMMESVKKILSDLEENSLSLSWFRLSLCSKLWRLDNITLDKVVEATSQIALRDNDEEEFFEALAYSASIAATQPHEPIAGAIMSCLLREAGGFNDSFKAEAGYIIILLASAAFVDEIKWLEWLEKQLAEYAFSLPKGIACRQLLENIEVLQMFFPIKKRCFGRARKFASSAL